jgi:hypothetical protein
MQVVVVSVEVILDKLEPLVALAAVVLVQQMVLELLELLTQAAVVAVAANQVQVQVVLAVQVSL